MQVVRKDKPFGLARSILVFHDRRVYEDEPK